MFEYRMRFITVFAVISLLSGTRDWCGTVSAETWRLEAGKDFKAVSAEGEDRYILAVARIKQLVNEGKTEAVREATEKLKTDFPEIAGPDLDAFMEAEMLFAEAKFVRAVRGYDKFLAKFPRSELYEAALDRQFSIATAFLAGQKRPVLKVFKIRGYAEGEKIMDRIGDRAGEAPIARKAAVAVAKGYEERTKFNEAYYKWSEILSRWPTGQTGKGALLSMARCKHAGHRGEKYSASNLISAKSYYENFKLRYPKDAEELNVDERLKQINEQLAYKQFSIGRYYQRTGSKQAANLYYQMVVDKWPKSTAAKMARAAMKDEKSGSKAHLSQ